MSPLKFLVEIRVRAIHLSLSPQKFVCDAAVKSNAIEKLPSFIKASLLGDVEFCLAPKEGDKTMREYLAWTNQSTKVQLVVLAGEAEERLGTSIRALERIPAKDRRDLSLGVGNVRQDFIDALMLHRKTNPITSSNTPTPQTIPNKTPRGHSRQSSTSSEVDSSSKKSGRRDGQIQSLTDKLSNFSFDPAARNRLASYWTEEKLMVAISGFRDKTNFARAAMLLLDDSDLDDGRNKAVHEDSGVLAEMIIENGQLWEKFWDPIYQFTYGGMTVVQKKSALEALFADEKSWANKRQPWKASLGL